MPKIIRNYVGRNYKKTRSSDRLSKQQRSSLMSKIHSKNTGLEKRFISLLRGNINPAFKTHLKKIRGKPDVVYEKNRICIFIDGDFWHGWQYPRWKHQMKNAFWRNKIENNRKRDRRNHRYLRKYGWKVLRVWEHDIVYNKNQLLAKIRSLLRIKR